MTAAEKVHPFVNWATIVDLKTGVPSKSAHANPHTDYNAKNICPSEIGAKGINPAAYSPKTKLFYASIDLTCMTFEPAESRYAKGQPWMGATISISQGLKAFGGLAAHNPFDNKLAWYSEEKFKVTSGTLATAGNLVFYNAGNRWFKASDAISGKLLWQFQISSISVGNPISFQHKGKQHVALLSGLNRKLASCGIIADVTCQFVDHGIYASWEFSESINDFGGVLHVFSL